MATSNPTGDGSAVALIIPPAHSAILRRNLAMCLEGVEGDIALAGDQHPHLERVRQEAAAYRRLLAGLDAGEIVPDADLRRVVAEMAKQTDESNAYLRVVREHNALYGLLDQISGHRGGEA